MPEEFNVRCQDIKISDKSLAEQYGRDWRSGGYQSASDIIDNNSQLRTKVFVADLLNNITDTFALLQSEIKDNIDNYLDELSNDLNININNLKNFQEYSATTTYSPFSFVYYNNLVYMHTGEESTGVLPTDINYWTLVGLRGDKGALGTGLNIKYNWSSSVSYVTKDMVVYNDKIWVAKSNNTNKTPASGSQYWEELVEFIKGAIDSSTTQPADNYVGQIWFKMTPIT